jgi:hypothetical protein
MAARPVASSGGGSRPDTSGVTQERSIACPPTIPTGPAARAITPITRSRLAAVAALAPGGTRASTWNASVSSPSPARMAMPSPATTCKVGRPRRIESSSMAGRSSWMSE